MSNPTEYTPTDAVVRGHYAWKSESIEAASSYLVGGERFDRWLVEHVRQVSERVHEDTVTVMAGLMPRGHTWLVPVNPYRKAGETDEHV